jgi:hypothetical protein
MFFFIFNKKRKIMENQIKDVKITFAKNVNENAVKIKVFLKNSKNEDVAIEIGKGEFIFSETSFLTKTLRIYLKRNILKIEEFEKPVELEYYKTYTEDGFDISPNKIATEIDEDEVDDINDYLDDDDKEILDAMENDDKDTEFNDTNEDVNVEPENNENTSDNENNSDELPSDNETELVNVDVLPTDSEDVNDTQVVGEKSEEEKEKDRQLSILEKKGKLEKPKQNAAKKTTTKKQTGRKQIRKTNSKSKK